jgi:hypothetical protein
MRRQADQIVVASRFRFTRGDRRWQTALTAHGGHEGHADPWPCHARRLPVPQ